MSLKKWKRKSNKSIKAHSIFVQAAWRTSIAHQSNSGADKFWGNGRHCVFKCVVCMLPEKKKQPSLSYGAYLFRPIQERERERERERDRMAQPEDASHTARRAPRSLQREHESIDNKKMNAAVRCKWISRVWLDSGFNGAWRAEGTSAINTLLSAHAWGRYS